ncbi:MAG: EAL domain-containing protein [Lachnospiraceae bacterium]|nr:EAL domain-containing protein [Lachnospiraceae bacterium]
MAKEKETKDNRKKNPRGWPVGKKRVTKIQRFRRLKKNHLAGALILFVVIALFTHLVLAVFALVFLNSLTAQKLRTCYESARTVARFYEQGMVSGKSRSMKPVFDEDVVYLILDQNGKVIDSSGEDTRAGEPFPVELPGSTDVVTVTADQSTDFLKQGSLFLFDLDYGMLVRYVNHVKADHDSRFFTDFANDNRSIAEPVWITVPLVKSLSMAVQTNLYVNMRDLGLLVAFVVGMSVLILLIILILIISKISSFVKQRKMTTIFFMDEVTDRHNWMWFIMRGNQILTKRQNAHRRYAVLDIVFMNYRNFCVCHSVSEGEEMLRCVDFVIGKHMGKDEPYAHYASANFAAMMNADVPETLDERIWALIRDLEQIDTEHSFSFHVGVDIVDVSLDAQGHVVRRRVADVENDYNNACAARTTIADKEESGIAYFTDKMVEEQRWMDTVRERQQKAIEGEEFLVYYQPKYDPRTKMLCGAEALIRWDSPEDGLIPPGRFIPIFEKNGFITKIDHYMLSHVARDQKAWLDAGYPCVPVSVNVSRAHFVENDLADQIRQIVDEAGTPHELIEIELTESAFFDDKRAMIKTIKALKDFGFSVSMDDFGAGYSSLNSLKDMPLDVLKLDADFFRGEDGNDRGKIVVSEAIRLAKNLHMRTVAEGVEIEEQVDFLADQGCDMIQGYYFSKPLPKDDYVGRMLEKTQSE